MNEINEVENEPIPKEELIAEFWNQRRMILSYIRRFVFDRDVREDIFQQACLKFLTAPATFRCFPAAAKYLHRTILSIVMDVRSKNSRYVGSDNLPESVCEPEPEWQKRMMFEKLNQALTRLSEKDRRLVAAYLSPGFSLKTASDFLDMPCSSYRYQVQKAISKLRKSLAPKIPTHRRTFQNQIGGN